MINGVSTFNLSGDTKYLSRQMDRISPKHFPGCIKRMLVLGCGDGAALNEMARTNPDWSFVGLDFNGEYIQKAVRGAPVNVEYICNAFNRFAPVDASFGVVASCGLLSWVEESDRKAIIRLSFTALEIGGYASFGFDNEFFWGELKGVREAFLAAWIETSDHQLARMLVHGLVKTVKFSSPKKAKFALAMIEQEECARHWIYQPHWKPMFPSQVMSEMAQSGFGNPEGVGSLMNLCFDGLTNQPEYIHWDFRRLP